MNDVAPHIVLLDLYSQGHHRSYLEILLSYWIASEPTGQLTVLTTTSFAQTHPDFNEAWGHLLPGQLHLRTLGPEVIIDENGSGVRHLLDADKMHGLAIEEAICLKPSHLVCMYLDHAQRAIPRLNDQLDKAKIAVSGILFRPTFHYPKRGVISWIRAARKKWFLVSLLKSPALKTVFSLDPYAVAGMNKMADQNKACVLPDGTTHESADQSPESLRKYLDIGPSKSVLLFFGILSHRKGIFESIKALKQLPKETAAGTVFLLVGRPNQADAAELEKQLIELQKVMRVIHISKYVSESRMSALFQACDLILAPYQHHVGSSGVLIRAARAGKPVVGSNYGLVGSNIRDHKLGLAIDSTRPAAISDAIINILTGENTGFDVSASSAYAADNTGPKMADRLFKCLSNQNMSS